jgi:hypothetical protein
MRDVLTSFYIGQQIGVCAFRGSFTEAKVLGVFPESNHLGGRWFLLTVELPDDEAVTIDSRQHVLVSAERYEDAWCPECRKRVEVEERTLEDTGDRATVVTEYVVARMVCGHTDEAVTREYRSPLQQVSALPRAYELGSLREEGL